MTTLSAVRRQLAGLVALTPGLLGLLAGCAERPEPVWLAEKGKVYCYRTLAEPDCYAWPLSGAEERLIGIGPKVYFRPL
ncbi:MAG: hypothetical protein ACREGK_10805 [Geminicoccales bacterium]